MLRMLLGIETDTIVRDMLSGWSCHGVSAATVRGVGGPSANVAGMATVIRREAEVEQVMTMAAVAPLRAGHLLLVLADLTIELLLQVCQKKCNFNLI